MSGARFIAAIGLLAAAPPDAAQVDQLPADRDMRSVLDLHNQVRARFGARPLRWNPMLAANAQRYAHILAASGALRHSPRLGRENERENIAVGPRSRAAPAQLAQVWVYQGRLFRPGIFPNVCRAGVAACGHFTQMIWPATTDLGCGFVRGRYEALVCRYSPPGNRDGVRLGSRHP